MAKYQRFAPVLRYLVEVPCGYSHPDSSGFTAGQTAWAEPRLQFHLYSDARAHALAVGGTVIKLRVSAAHEPFGKG